ncbi:MAG: hypothetical protein H7336_03530 [Bacteriovorax sp.]|nr:hypothetical protein [Bacteriovorax sp.]
MKIFGLLLFVFIFEVYGQSTKSRPEALPNARAYRDDIVINGQSKDKRTYAADAIEKSQKSSSITGTICMNRTGQELNPTSKGYRKCVDQANRTKN